MKIKYLKLKNWLLVSLGGLLGVSLSGCDDNPIACEYGCPEGFYSVKGTVTDSKGNPVSGIGVGQVYTESGGVVLPDMRFQDTTDADGRYAVGFYALPDDRVEVDFVDLDGPENGLYRDTTITVSAPQSAFHGGDGNWNYGTAEITQDVVLTPAE